MFLRQTIYDSIAKVFLLLKKKIDISATGSIGIFYQWSCDRKSAIISLMSRNQGKVI